MYFLSFRIFEQLALALKNRVALEFFTVLNMYFLSFRIFEQLALALKYFKPGGRPSPPTPASYAYASARHHVQVICMKLIENRISNLFGRCHVQWEEKQTPLYVLHFPQLLPILEKSHLIGIRHIRSTVE